MSGRGGGIPAASLVVSLVCMVLAGCAGPKSRPPTTVQYEPGMEQPIPGQTAGTISQQPTEPAPDTATQMVTVRGADGFADLGPVPLGSTHVVTFVIENPSDQAIHFKTVRSECECIKAEAQPAGVEAHGSVRIPVRYKSPQVAKDYESRVIIVTDDPDRRVIALRVASKGPRQ
jgi:hypothetical protein